MKICIVTEYYYPLLGGISEHVHNTGLQLLRMGHEVWIITSNQIRREGNAEYWPDKSPFTIVRIGRSWGAHWNGSVTNVTLGFKNLWTDMRAVMLRERFDIVHVHSPLVPTLPLIGILATPCHRVATFHSYFDHSLFYWALRHVAQRYFIDKLDGQIAVSQSCLRALEPYFRMNARIIPNGIDLDAFSPDAPTLSKYDDGKLNLLFLSRLEPRTGLDLMLQAFDIVKRQQPQVRLVVVGDGPRRAEYELMVPREYAHDVDFVGPVLAERASYYRTADIYCAPISKASFGMTLLEAMASGTPIVATENDGYRDLLGPEEGVLVPHGDPQTFADAILTLLADKDLRARMGRAGLAKAAHYAWPKIAEQLVSFYEEILSRPREALRALADGRR
ncbi:MAG: glycosyltransferase family 4 protein [Acidobacteria bacterium]|nr:glycosyltransferase family 4 protein [Acidobacteriota bacterium]